MEPDTRPARRWEKPAEEEEKKEESE